MIVGYKTERFVTVQRHTDPAYGYLAIGNEVLTGLHATKGWRHVRHRRQIIGPCESRDVRRALASGLSVTFKRAGKPRDRGVAAIPITEKMLMRHGWYRRQKEREARAAATAAWNEGATQ